MPKEVNGLKELLEVSLWYENIADEKFEYAQPDYLYLLWGIPVVIILSILIKLLPWGTKFKIATNNHKLSFDPWSLLAFIPPLILGCSFVLLIIALAQPQKSDEKSESYTEGIDIMLALDVSGSMEHKDLKPNRLEALKKVAEEFVAGRNGDRIGIVIFAEEAYIKTPLTTDYELLKKQIKEIKQGDIAPNGTAIGDGIGVCTSKLKESTAESKVIILISDGENNSGKLKPEQTSSMAAAYNCKIYAIGIGGDQIPVEYADFFGRKSTRMVKSEFNEKDLQQIAANGGGKYFRATDNKSLKNIFEEINNLEKSEIKEDQYKETTDYYHIYLAYGIILLLIWFLCKSTFLTNAMQD